MNKKDKNIKHKKIKRNAKMNFEDIPASSRRMQYYKMKRNRKRIKSTIFKMHTLVKYLLIIFILWCSSRLMICSYWYLPQSTFDTYPNKNLNIIGNKITPDDKIISALKTIPIQQKPIYLMNTIPYEKEIEKLSPVKKAFIRRYWLPARLEVTIEEQVPVLTVSPNPNAPEIAALTLDGQVISKEYLPINDKKYKTYKILTYDDYNMWSKHEILSLQTLAQRIEDYSSERLVYLDIRNKKDVFAQLETVKIRIGEFNTTLKSRVERLTSIMSQIEDMKNKIDYVDIRWDNNSFLKNKTKPRIIPNFQTQTNSRVQQLPSVQNKLPNSSIVDMPRPKTVEP